MNQRAEELRQKAAECDSRAAESFERCDTDGCVSQWANNMTARKYREEAELEEAGGMSSFVGLYQGNRRVKARQITYKCRFSHSTQTSWLLHDDEAELIEARGKKFLPVDYTGRGRIQKRLGLHEAPEIAPGRVVMTGSGRGLSGLHTVRPVTIRAGDKWGQDATCTGAFSLDDDGYRIWP